MSQKKLHLQGLRGFAIISVALFHFFPEWCPNGYLGVDQFFLLSGYLMTMMLHRYCCLNTTKILDFLYRRVKRVVPLYYLVTALILGTINVLPTSAINTNFVSSIYALLFMTNLIRPLGMEGYAEKLGIAVDMFTHTWSLALEMQFYLLFPFIYILVGFFQENRRNYVIALLGAFSFTFYLIADNFLSFNCVTSRIWQFLAGMLAFSNSTGNNNYLELRDLEEDKKQLIDGKETPEEERDLKKLIKLITALSIFSMAILLFGPHVIDPLFGRVNIVLVTGLIVHLGEGCSLLENQLIIFFGEISYCWYLTHWPIIALCKMNGFTSRLELAYGLIASFSISLIIHRLFEKFYLKWEKKAIGLVLFALMLVNGGALLQIYGIMPKTTVTIPPKHASNDPENLPYYINASHLKQMYIFQSDHLPNLPITYKHMAEGARIQLNNNFDANDITQLFRHPCERISTNNSREVKCQVGKIRNTTTPLSLLVVGNSWAQNSMGVVYDECQDVFSSIYMSATAGCEPLFRTVLSGYDCSTDLMFVNAAKEHHPDVLMVITRHITSMTIENGTNPFDDQNFNTAVKRIQELEKFVKKKIYLLDVFPQPSVKVSQILNDHLARGTPINDSELIDLSPRYLIAKERMYRLVQGCGKCQLFDYATQFYFNGLFKIYDPKYYVSFFTKGQHLTPPGLERIRPLIHHICHHL